MIQVIASGSNELFKIQNYSASDNLASNEVTSIVEDDFHMVWFGTTNGLSRFDGYRFESFRSIDFSPLLSLSNNIRYLGKDKEGYIWIVTDREIAYLNPGDCKVTVTTIDKTIVKNIKCLYVTRNNEVLIGADKGLYLFDKELLEFKNIYQGKVNTLFQDSNGNLWIGTWGRGAFTFNLQTKKIEHTITEILKKKLAVTSFTEDAQHRIWISTWESNGLYRMDFSGAVDSIPQIKNYPISNKKGMLTNPVLYKVIYNNEDNSIWVATAGGLFRLDNTDEADAFQTFDTSLIMGTEIFSMFIDSRGIVWASILGSGISKIIKQNHSFAPLQYYNNANYLLDNKTSGIITSIYEMPDSSIWFGTRLGILDIWDRENEKCKNYTQFNVLNQIKRGSNAILSLAYDSDRNITWLATRYDGVYFLYKDGEKYVITRICDKYRKLAISPSVCVGKDGKVWMSSVKGLFRLKFTSDDFKDFIVEPVDAVNKLLYNSEIRTLSSHNGNLWIGTDLEGLLCLNAKGECHVYNSENHKLSYNNVSSIFEDSFHRLWVGTQGGGLNLYNKENDCFNVVDQLSTVSNNLIYSIIEDQSRNLWMTTGKGVVCMSLEEMKQVELYSAEDGIRNTQFTPRAACCLSDGTLLFGGFKGVDCYAPKQKAKDEKDFGVAIVDIAVMNTPLKKLIDEGTVKCEVLPPYVKELTLRYNQNNIVLGFRELSYLNSKTNRYAYKMSNIDQDWLVVDSDKSNVSYNNLTPGKYVFSVKACNSESKWMEPVYLRVTILPPPWLTWWAFVLYFLVVVGIAYFFFWDIRRRISLRDALKLEQIERTKSNELNQAKLKFFTNISHELFTPLSVMQCSIDRLVQNQQMDDELLSIMRINLQRLKRLLQQIMEFRKAESGNLKLKVSNNDIVPFIRNLCQQNFVPLLEKKKISLSFNVEKDSIYAYFDIDKIDKIMYNLLSNAMKYNYREGAILVSVSQSFQEDKRFIQLKIENTGDGIPEAKLPNLFKRFYEGDYRKFKTQGTGIGLSLTKDLVDLHHGTIQVHSIPGETTVFTVLFPADKEAYSEDQLDNMVNETVPELPEIGGAERIKLLLVEDDEELLLVMSKVLSVYFDVSTAMNGVEALKLLEEDSSIEFVITDYIMPAMNGIDLCEKIRSTSSLNHLPVIMLTARTQVEHQVRGYQAGVDSYVTKPIEMSVLIAQIKVMLRNRKIIVDNFKEKDNLDTDEMEISQLDKEFLSEAIKVVEDNMENSSFSNDDFALKMNMSTSTLYRKLKSVAGMSGNEFIKNIRIKKACILLKNPDLQITEVAYKVGFTDPKYFSVVFKKEKGISPSKYIESLQMVEK